MNVKWVSLLLLLLVLVGCAAETVEVTRVVGTEVETTDLNPAVERSHSSEPLVMGEVKELEVTEVVEVEIEAFDSPATAAPLAGAPAEEVAPSYDDSDSEGGLGGAEMDAPRQQVSSLKAGEVDDNRDWDDYLLYRRQYGRSDVHNVDVSERYVIEVLDAVGNTVHNALVQVSAGQDLLMEAVADAGGRVLFHPNAYPLAGDAQAFTIRAVDPADPELAVTVEFDREPTLVWEVTLPGEQTRTPVQLDVLFLIDTTGSMDDEIDALKNSVLEISAQIDALPERPDLSFGMVLYRDREDVFVTRSYDFEADISEFHRQLLSVTANGGGDYPESLNEGLHVALHQVSWRDSKTVRLVFLIADAPPHLDYSQDYDYAEEMVYAASQGIKIFPIASSGLDDQGEYIYRQIAQFTGGKFIFLTYAEAGSPSSGPGDETTHHVDDYTVKNLDVLVVQLVEEELSKLSR